MSTRTLASSKGTCCPLKKAQVVDAIAKSPSDAIAGVQLPVAIILRRADMVSARTRHSLIHTSFRRKSESRRVEVEGRARIPLNLLQHRWFHTLDTRH